MQTNVPFAGCHRRRVPGDIDIEVTRGPYLTLPECGLAGATGTSLGLWDRWLCCPVPAGWRLYTNR